jgi:hypothetical protein
MEEVYRPIPEVYSRRSRGRRRDHGSASEGEWKGRKLFEDRLYGLLGMVG